MILLTGFGPFRQVTDNPSGVLARSLDGARMRGLTVVGRELDVSYERAAQETLALARHFEPVLVVGTGVAMTRSSIEVERIGRGGPPEGEDNDGACPKTVGTDYRSLVAEPLAQALGAGLSDDAGRYVCNAWLVRVGAGSACPVAFVHLPPQGADPQNFLEALGVVATRLHPGSR